MTNKGFTLIELMVAIGIMAIVSSVGYAVFSNAQAVGRDGKRKEDLESLRQALIVYQQSPGNNHLYPDTASFNTLVPTYISRMPQDPSTKANYDYQSASPNTTYFICATLENPNASDPHPDCTNPENYEVTPPQ